MPEPLETEDEHWVEVSVDHITNNRQCWCEPQIRQYCPECQSDEEPGPPKPDCWKCAGEGTVPFYDDEQPAIVIHEDPAT